MKTLSKTFGCWKQKKTPERKSTRDGGGKKEGRENEGRRERERERERERKCLNLWISKMQIKHFYIDCSGKGRKKIFPVRNLPSKSVFFASFLLLNMEKTFRNEAKICFTCKLDQRNIARSKVEEKEISQDVSLVTHLPVLSHSLTSSLLHPIKREILQFHTK